MVTIGGDDGRLTPADPGGREARKARIVGAIHAVARNRAPCDCSIYRLGRRSEVHAAASWLYAGMAGFEAIQLPKEGIVQGFQADYGSEDRKFFMPVFDMGLGG